MPPRCHYERQQLGQSVARYQLSANSTSHVCANYYLSGQMHTAETEPSVVKESSSTMRIGRYHKGNVFVTCTVVMERAI